MAMMGIVMVINSQVGPLVIVYIDALMRIRAFTFDLSACNDNEQHAFTFCGTLYMVRMQDFQHKLQPSPQVPSGR